MIAKIFINSSLKSSKMLARYFAEKLPLSQHFLDLSNYKSASNFAKKGNWNGCKLELSECLRVLEYSGQAEKSIEAAYTLYKYFCVEYSY